MLIPASSSSTQASIHEHNSLSRVQWANVITASWQGQVASIFETGEYLQRAQGELRHGEWIAMIENDLPFSRQTANKLMKVTVCDHLRNDAHVRHLPAHWGTLYELTTLTEEQFEGGIKTGAINPKMLRKDVKALRGDDQSIAPAERNVSPFAVLKRRAAEQEHEIRQLKAKLSNVQDGSLFDLRKDTPKNIADVVAGTVSEAKAIAIAEAIKSAIKAKKAAGT
jgi:hypothetical protein